MRPVPTGLALATFAVLGCTWIMAHDPPAQHSDGDAGGWEPPNTQEDYCGGNFGCEPSYAQRLVGAGLDGGCDG
jgi:hypothetical protein